LAAVVFGVRLATSGVFTNLGAAIFEGDFLGTPRRAKPSGSKSVKRYGKIHLFISLLNFFRSLFRACTRQMGGGSGFDCSSYSHNVGFVAKYGDDEAIQDQASAGDEETGIRSTAAKYSD